MDLKTQNTIKRAHESMAELRKFLKELEPTEQADVLLAEDTKFGIVDPILFDKSKPDKNGVYSGIKIIKQSFNSMKDLVKAIQTNPNMFESVATIAYKPVNDNYHYILIRKLNIDKNNLEKYLLLL
jgi:hypothetical protein